MTRQKYRKQFARAIKYAPKNIRNEILTDIDAILADPNTDLAKFGSPQQLAAQYLQDFECTPTATQKALIWARNGFTIFGIVAIGIFAIIFGTMYYYSNYQVFAYENQKLAETHEDFNVEYRLSKDNNIFKAAQVSIVLYSHDKEETLMRCQTDISTTKDIININQNACLIFVPKGKFTLEANQTKVTLIEPKSDWDITSKQTTIALHAGTSTYRVKHIRKQTSGNNFANDDNAKTSLTFNTYQSNLEVYDPS